MKPNKRTIVARLRAFTGKTEQEGATRIETLEQSIAQIGEIFDLCTWHDLGRVCSNCRCPYKAKRTAQSKKGA